MPIVQTVTNVFKSAGLTGGYDFTVDTFKIALYSGSADLGAETASYTTAGEVVGDGYVAGGAVLTPVVSNASGTNPAFVTFSDVSWAAAITARGALIYKQDGVSNPTVCVLDFGADKTSTTVFNVQFPAATSTAAIIRIY